LDADEQDVSKAPLEPRYEPERNVVRTEETVLRVSHAAEHHLTGRCRCLNGVENHNPPPRRGKPGKQSFRRRGARVNLHARRWSHPELSPQGGSDLEADCVVCSELVAHPHEVDRVPAVGDDHPEAFSPIRGASGPHHILSRRAFWRTDLRLRDAQFRSINRPIPNGDKRMRRFLPLRIV